MLFSTFVAAKIPAAARRWIVGTEVSHIAVIQEHLSS